MAISYTISKDVAGYPARGAVAWVRSSYCAKAVETPEQEAFVATLFSS